MADERKQEILMAALEVFTEKGYDKASMDDIVRASDLSKGTLYWHFKNKQELFGALIDMVAIQLEEKFLPEGSPQDDPTFSAAAYLRQLVDRSLALIEEDVQFIRLLVDIFLQTAHNESALRAWVSYYNTFIEKLAGVIQHGMERGEFRTNLDARVQAQALAGALDGVMFQIVLFPKEQVVPVVRGLIETLIDGLERKE